MRNYPNGLSAKGKMRRLIGPHIYFLVSLHIVKDRHYLGGFVDSDVTKEKYIKSQVKIWCGTVLAVRDLDKLAQK